MTPPILHPYREAWVRIWQQGGATTRELQDLSDGTLRRYGPVPGAWPAFLPGEGLSVLTSTASYSGIPPTGRYRPGGLRETIASIDPPGLETRPVRTGLERILDQPAAGRTVVALDDDHWVLEGTSPEGRAVRVVVNPRLEPLGLLSGNASVASSGGALFELEVQPCAADPERSCLSATPIELEPI